MSRRARLGFALISLVLGSSSALARPGGGSSFRSSSSSGSSSSGSSSRSSSSGSSSRSSSGSSWSSSGSSGDTRSPSTPSTPAPLVLSLRSGDPASRAATWQLGAASLYGVPPPRPDSTRVTGADERATELFALSFLFGAGFIMTVLLGGAGVLFIRRRRLPSGWSTQPAHEVVVPLREELEAIRRRDPDFSVVSFEDFVYGLYAELHTARGAGQLERFAPWLGPEAHQALLALEVVPVSTVVLGALRYGLVQVSDEHGATVELELEANYTEQPPNAGARSYWTQERWELRRGASAKSRPPERVRVFTCPSCGAPADQVVGGVCRYCQQLVNTGDFDWIVDQIHIDAREERPPMLTGTTEEQGTALPTRVDARLPAMFAQLAQRDPSFDQNAFFARAELVFRTLQTAWSSLDWQLARPYLSDNLWTAQTYWIEAYRRSGLRNVTENARISRIELARITADRWFDAITVRIHAASLDYTLRDSDGAVVGGSRERPRSYTEYWTFIRGTGAKGAARTDPVCPSCGSPFDINAAGECSHCHVKLTAGRFDWVLSRIEQDEVYAG